MSSWKLSQKEIELVRQAERLAASLQEEAAAADRSGQFPINAYRAAAEAGFVGIAVPKMYGGQDLSTQGQAAVIEALAGGCAAVVGAVIGNGIQAALPILYGATEELRRSFLPELVSGKRQVALAITEANAGSDMASLRCRATRVSGGWRLDGEKVLINRASLSDHAIVFATIDPDLRHRGITAFLANLQQTGVTVGPALSKMGQRGLPTESIRFEGAFVPESHQLSQVGAGFPLMKKILNRARVMVAANAVGRMRTALDYAVAYVIRREQFGAPLANLENVRAEIADMALAVQEGHCLTALAADAVEKEAREQTLYASMAKLRSTSACIEVCRSAMLLCGGLGYTDVHPVERMMRDAMAGQVVDGANPVQKQIIAKEYLKLPKARQ